MSAKYTVGYFKGVISAGFSQKQTEGLRSECQQATLEYQTEKALGQEPQVPALGHLSWTEATRA